MPWGAVQLKPGVDTQLTLSANTAGVAQSQLIRYKDGLIQSYGGFTDYVPFTIGSTVRDLHPWQDAAGVKHLGVGATGNLVVITAGSAQDITPQTNTTNPAPNFSISSGSDLVTVVDAGSSASVFNVVYFNTPVAIGAFLLNGAYPINSVLGSSIYTLKLPSVSSATVASSGKLPVFAASSGSATITVTLSNHNFQAISGLFQQFIALTSVGGLTVQGKYQINTVIDSTSFTINAVTQATSTATATMNASLAQLKYYITLGPAPGGTGFSAGGYSSGAFSGLGGGSAGVSGTPITTADWTSDNWGEVWLTCPKDGPIYAWAPNFGFQNAQVVHQAPFFNGGIFVAMPQQILVAWRSVQSTGVQDALRVRWSDQEDYTNWIVSNQTTAGSFHLPTGSEIVGGMQAPGFALISTDVDVWTMSYVGGTVIFNFTKVGTGCGWIGPAAAGVLGDNPCWMGTNNFFMLSGRGVSVIPCPVWDQVFQNLKSGVDANNVPYVHRVRCAINAAFNEVTWHYPSAASAGENDSYVKLHIGEGQGTEWDYGALPRTAWADVSILGGPLGADPSGSLIQHESGNAITGAGLPSFRTGWWAISEGQELAQIDFVIPDFIWGTRAGAQDASVAVTFFSVNHPADTPFTHGPYVVTQATQYLNVRIRGRLMSMLVQSNASSQFWRLGRIRYRYAPAGRR
jgi:hypothetical protein